MEKKFIIFVVLVITQTQTSSGGLLDTTLGWLTSIVCGNNNDDGNSPIEEPEDLSTVGPKKPNPTVTDSARIEAARNLSSCACEESATLIFTTVDFEAGRVTSGPRNEYKRGGSLTEIAEVAEFGKFKIALNSYFHAILIAQPEASSTVKKVLSAAHTELRKAVAGLNDGIELISKKHCTDIPIQIERIHKETTISSVNMMDSVYVAILNGRNSSCKTGAQLVKAKKKSTLLVAEVVHDIFEVTKFGLIKTFPDLQFQGFDCPSSIMTLENKVVGKILALVDSVYSGIDIIFKASSEKLTDNYGHY